MPAGIPQVEMNPALQVVLHKAGDLDGSIVEDLHYPLLETDSEWVVHGFSYANYLADLGDEAHVVGRHQHRLRQLPQAHG